MATSERLAMRFSIFSLFIVAIVFNSLKVNATKYDEAAAITRLEELNSQYVEETNEQMNARWNYITNVNEDTGKTQVEANIKFAEFQKKEWKENQNYKWSEYKDPNIRREFKYLNILGSAALEGDSLKRYNELAQEMESTYSTAKVCKYGNDTDCSLALEPELTEIMATSTDYDELTHYWVKWSDAAGKPIRKQYLEFAELNNKAARDNNNGYNDMGSLWNDYYLYEGYSEDDFKVEIEKLWQAVKPLYLELFTYVRRILSDRVYPGNVHVQRYGSLPAHVLGNIWAQAWGNIAKHVLPFNATAVDATPGMIKQNYDAQKMFNISEEFFSNLGLGKMTETFKMESLKEKPTDGREVVCHASAEDFFKEDDFRIKMCTAVNQEDLVTVHHEMGHIQYFMEYQKLHWVFRNGANPGFHEAIGDTIALAVSTPAHLLQLGLIEENTNDKSPPLFDNLPELPKGVSGQDMNYLLSQALDKIAFLPFGYLMDKWRWSVFNGNTTDKNLNEYWWTLREELQGLKAPVKRSEEDFDPGAKYHIPANVEYIRYFISYIVQFQFYEALCKVSGYDQNAPLYKCDFGNSTEAGAKLSAMLQLGFSKPWPEALEKLTGNKALSADSLIKYFKPLNDWLGEANKMAGDCIGWEGECSKAPVDNTVPIIVGAVLCALVLVVIVAYFVGRRRVRRVEAQPSSPGEA